jgi:hypothetical protein
VVADDPPVAYVRNFAMNASYCWICAQTGLWIEEQQRFCTEYALRQHLRDTHRLVVIDPPSEAVASPLVARIESVFRRSERFSPTLTLQLVPLPRPASCADMIH